jgi:hypothetical protein
MHYNGLQTSEIAVVSLSSTTLSVSSVLARIGGPIGHSTQLITLRVWRIWSVVENSWDTLWGGVSWAPFGVVGGQGRNDLCEIWERHDQDTDLLVGVHVGF